VALDEMLLPPRFAAPVDAAKFITAQTPPEDTKWNFQLPADELEKALEEGWHASWGTYFRSRWDAEELDTKDVQLLKALTAAYTGPLTLVHALIEMGFIMPEQAGQRSVGLEEAWQAQLQEQASQATEKEAHLKVGDSPLETISIHVLQATQADVALLANYYTELAALLPWHLIEVTLVGSSLESEGFAEVCDRLNVSLHCCDYAQYLTSEEAARPPDLAVAFNPGMAATPELWKFSVDALLQSRVPLLVTACCEAERDADLHWLQDQNAKVALPPSTNPMASMLLEVLHRQGEGRVVRANDWWWVVKGQAISKPR